MICCWLSLLSRTLSTDARYLFRQVVFRSHLLTPASHLGSPKGSPHPPTSLLLHVVAVLLVQWLTLQDTLFCVQCRALALHSLPVSPHITLHQSLDPLPCISALFPLFYFSTKCSSFVPPPPTIISTRYTLKQCVQNNKAF